MALEGKAAIVTGSSSGIGEAIARAMAKNGAKVVITARRKDRLKALEAEFPGQMHHVPGDMTDESLYRKIVDETVTKFGRIDILVNNAGTVVPAPVNTGVGNKLEFVPGMSAGNGHFGLKAYDKQFNLNLRAVVGLCEVAIPELIKTQGNIVMISTIGSQRPGISIGLYSMSKAALDMMTKSLAIELAHCGVRVNSVNPGCVETEIFGSSFGIPPEQMEGFIEQVSKMAPLQRIGQPTEIAEAVLYLADNNKAGFTTGAHLFVDGGCNAALGPQQS